jgi:2-dehydropantoate 2-reductase
MHMETVSLIGLGALGVMYGNHLSKRMPARNLRIIADSGRINRYKKEGVFCNGELCDFYFVTPDEKCGPADLLIFAVKFNNLHEAIEAVKNHVGQDTVIISLLNGISSEEIIARTYGPDKIIDCVAQGMDAVKEGNRLIYSNMGVLCIGSRGAGTAAKVNDTAEFFEKTGVPHIVDSDMKKRMWGKFMLNVGVNQTVAVYESGYGEIQHEGPARDLMISAMREVMALSEKEGVFLTEDDLNYWLDVLKPLNPANKPSMRQDLEAKRCSEVELFSGTVLKLGRKHGIPTPVNKLLYDKIKSIESKF